MIQPSVNAEAAYFILRTVSGGTKYCWSCFTYEEVDSVRLGQAAKNHRALISVFHFSSSLGYVGRNSRLGVLDQCFPKSVPGLPISESLVEVVKTGSRPPGFSRMGLRNNPEEPFLSLQLGKLLHGPQDAL